jgi:hypothetical protein
VRVHGRGARCTLHGCSGSYSGQCNLHGVSTTRSTGQDADVDCATLLYRCLAPFAVT